MKLKSETYTLQSSILLLPCVSLILLRNTSVLCFTVAWIKWTFQVNLFMKAS